MKVLVGGISPEGEHILSQYLNAFLPEAEIEPIKATGIRGALKRGIPNPSVFLVIIEDSLYQRCLSDCADVLNNSKVHRYTTDSSLNEFLISKFGKLDESQMDSMYGIDNASVTPPDKLMGSANSVNTIIDDDENLSVVASMDIDKVETDDTVINSRKTDELEAKIAELQDKLALDESIISNLRAQLEEENDDSDAAELVARISELQDIVDKQAEQLKNAESGETDYEALGKVAKAEQVIKQFDDLKTDLRKAREDNSALQHDKSELDKQVKDLDSQLGNLSSQIEQLTASVNDKTAKINELQTEVDNKDDLLVSKEAELQGKSSELGIVQDKLKEMDDLSAELTTLKTDLQQKGIEYDNLKVDYESKVAEYNKVSDDLKSLTVQLEEKDKKITELSATIDTLSQSGTVSSEQITDLSSQVNSLRTELITVRDELKAKEGTITDLTSQIENLNINHKSEIDKLHSEYQVEINSINQANTAKIVELQEEQNMKLSEMQSSHNSELADLQKSHEAELSKLQVEITKSGTVSTQFTVLQKNYETLKAEKTNLDAEISKLKTEIYDKDARIKELTESSTLNQEDLAVKTEALDKIIAEKNDLINQLATAKEESINLQGQITELTKQHQTELAEKDTKYSELEQENTKLTNKVESLKASLIDAQADSDSISRLESDLLEERRKSARLSSELEVIKKSEGTGKSAELRVEIARLNNELKQAKSESVDTSEVAKLREELAEARAKTAELETTVLEKDEQIDEISDGVFGQIANLSMPKVAYDISLGMKEDFSNDHIYCYASGSDESSSLMFSTIRRSCMANPKARIIILDLTTDSTIDRDLGVQSVKSPINWITGSEEFLPYLANTKFNNVKVLSTALAYMNDLFLLNIDWGKRINELKAFADAIIINVGCINNLVAKILFNTFSQCMKSHIIVKATPINIRATILNITGFSHISENVTVDCINFDNSSKQMYQRLATKCKATIIKDSDIIAL